MITALASAVGFLSDLLQVSSPLIDQSQILILDHCVRLSAHMIGNGQPVCAKMCNILVEVLQFRN